MQKTLFTMIACLLLAACTTSQKNGTDSPATGADTSVVPPATAPVAPGAVRLSGLLSQCEGEAAATCTLRVQAVHARGAAAKSVATDTDLQIQVAVALFDGDADKMNTWLASSGAVEVTVQAAEPGLGTSSTLPVWVVRQVH